MKYLIILFSLILFFSVSQAAIFPVATGGAQPYAQVQPAITAASSGDTILVFPGIYNGFIVNRRLVVMGAGTSDLGEGVKITGLVEVNDAADSTELRSLWIRTNLYTGIDSTSTSLLIHSGATEILVWRCFIENYTVAGTTARCAFAGNGTSTQWVQGVFWASATNPCTGLTIKNSSTASVTSCVFSFVGYGIEGPSGTFIAARHCVFTNTVSFQPFVTQAFCTAENSVFMSSGSITYSSGPSVGYYYCASTSPTPLPGATNFFTTSAAFQNLIYNNPRTSNYYLSATSNLRDAGRPDSLGGPPDLDNTCADIGIYGGLHPFVEGGIPDYPFMLRLEAPITVPQDGVMRIWARGQVGPGY